MGRAESDTREEEGRTTEIIIRDTKEKDGERRKEIEVVKEEILMGKVREKKKKRRGIGDTCRKE